MTDTFTYSDVSVTRSGDSVTFLATLTLPTPGWQLDLVAAPQVGVGSVFKWRLVVTEPDGIVPEVITDYPVGGTFDTAGLLYSHIEVIASDDRIPHLYEEIV
jgi:hypothetical protein